MSIADKSLTCSDCNEEFVFTVTEQAYYKDKGFDYQPQRCAGCRSTLFERRKESGVRYRHGRRAS